MRSLIFLLLVFLNIVSEAQRLKIKNYSIGYRAFEIDAVGNNPSAIAPFLKDSWTYKNYINQIQYNSVYGNPGVQILRDYFINMDLQKISESRFWKKNTIQLGLFLSNQLRKDNMALANDRFVISPNDTTLFSDKYSIAQKQQFAGVNVGFNRRIQLSKQLQFITGFHLQGGIAFLHEYSQRWDSSFYRRQVWTTRTFFLPDLKGKNFFQWRAMIPLGLELNVYKQEFFVRAEFDLGIVGDPFRKEAFTKREAHGYGIWLIYQPLQPLGKSISMNNKQ